ncbi:MAG: hypothetical protein WCT85_06745 [Parachlamydiales bacterium]|jgi:hypothetical protein
MHCYKCNKKLNLPSKKISFKETCPFCQADLHVCKNCRHYVIGKPNDCNILNIDLVQDKEKNNFCEDFSFKDKLEKQIYKSKGEISKKLFKNSDDDSPPNNSFNSLFKN